MHPLLGPVILSILNRSVADAAGISAELSNFVNPCAAILCALPVMSIVVSHRRVGIVCLSHRLTAIVAERQCLHRCRSHEERIRAVRAMATNVVRNTCPRTIVLERSACERRAARRVRDALADWAEGLGLRVIELSRHDASENICGQRSLRSAFERIVSRYPVSDEESFTIGNSTQVPIHEWEARMPLITAFVLTHSVAARAIITALGRETSVASKPYARPKP